MVCLIIYCNVYNTLEITNHHRFLMIRKLRMMYFLCEILRLSEPVNSKNCFTQECCMYIVWPSHAPDRGVLDNINAPSAWWLVHGQVTIILVVSVCLFVCAEFFSAVFDPISIKLGHMLGLYVGVWLCPLEYRGCAIPEGGWPLKYLYF